MLLEPGDYKIKLMLINQLLRKKKLLILKKLSLSVKIVNLLSMLKIMILL